MYAPDSDSIIRWHGCTARRFPAHDSFVYLIHFEQKIGNPEKARGMAQHYLGSTGNLEARLQLHRNGNGSAIMTAVGKAGVGWQIARLWRVDERAAALALERKLKDRHDGPGLCPICQRRGVDVLVAMRQGHWPFALFAKPGKRRPMNASRPVFVRRAESEGSAS